MKDTNRHRTLSRKGSRSVKGKAMASQSRSTVEPSGPASREQSIATIKNAAGVILAVTENRNWIEVFFGGDLMHTQTVNLPSGTIYNIYIEEVPHKTTVYEFPRTMIFFTDPCDLEITRQGDRVIVMGSPPRQDFV